MILLAAIAMMSGPKPGENLQRTMTLLATSTPQKRNTVRILFYGQSITYDQPWTRMVIDDLKRRFPNADIQTENRAISGFAANYLKKTAVYDVLPYYPDLVVLHDYGGEPDYEELIRQIVTNTATEVAVMDDFEPSPLKGDEPENVVRSKKWHDQHSTWLKELCTRYRLGFISTRDPWKEHVKATGETAKDLTSDGTHPNEKGNALMTRVVAPQLFYDRKLSDEGWADRVLDYRPNWRKGSTGTAFDGNRVDIVPDFNGPEGKPARILIDGKSPSSFNECYAFTRPTIAFASWMPMIVRLGSQKLRQVEDWTLTVTHVDAEASTFRYRLEGSKTGPDGEGSSTEDFVSKSGRVTIGKDDWAVKYAYDVAKQAMPVGFQCRWSVIPMFKDVYVRPVRKDPTLEAAVTVAQGLPAGMHKLRVIPEDGKPIAIQSIRVYRPRRAPSEGR